VNTGFGNFADVAIPPGQLAELQRNLVRSHSAGVGAPLSDRVVRAMMVLRANALAKGFSGIRVATVESLLRMLAADVLPVIPEQGSVGASGDLAPLAHLALALMGEGHVRRRGRVLPAGRALREAGLAPVVLAAKEGLALVNGVQMSVAVGGLALERALFLCRVADIAGAASLDAARGSDAAFDPRILSARPHPGAVASAKNLRALLSKSAIRESHRGCGKIQDNYALRCMPQVHGAARDAFEHARGVIEREMNSATDNPLVFARGGGIVSGGNFHGAPVGLVLDYAAIAATDLASISERRIEKLVNPTLSDLPGFLVAEGGLNSGLMMAQVTAAALVSECKVLAHPASVDSIPTSADKEDHVSMSPIAPPNSRRSWRISRESSRPSCSLPSRPWSSSGRSSPRSRWRRSAARCAGSCPPGEATASYRRTWTRRASSSRANRWRRSPRGWNRGGPVDRRPPVAILLWCRSKLRPV
jgi:histidine ammonia-lyase